MGGCRCYFRDCHGCERYKKWRQYAKMDQILEFSDVRRRNTNICGRHFRVECFMNYKMDRLTPSAIPTIMRLSEDKALDFELDIESGVLVNLEPPKAVHLLPPDGFESPLFLTNDKILLEILNKLQIQQYDKDRRRKLMELEQNQCEEFSNNPTKTLAKSVQILETIHVAAPSSKRPGQKRDDKNLVSGIRNKKRILNAPNCTGGNYPKKVSTVVLASIENSEAGSEELNLVETIQLETPNEVASGDGQFFLTNESFIDDDSDEEFEIFQIHKSENDLHSELPTSDSDATIIQIKPQIHSNVPESESIEIVNIQKQSLEFDKLKEDFDALYVKYSILETENKQLKKNCQQTEEIKKKQLLLQVENNNLKKSLNDYEAVKEKLQKYSEENQKLKSEITDTKALRAELVSRKEETKELRKLVDSLKHDDPKGRNIELEIKNKEINGLQRKLELLQCRLNGTAVELKEVRSNLNNVENENERLIQNENKLEECLKNVKTSLDSKQTDYNALKSNFEVLEQKHSELEGKYWKLEALRNQEATVSTSLEKEKNDSNPAIASAPSISASSLTKAQLFNGIKRYLCSSMVSLLRMEMFGNTERAWKTDERQVAVDILRLGEVVYKYFTDEWRIRLPAMRDARNWLGQSQQLMEEDEEDL